MSVSPICAHPQGMWGVKRNQKSNTRGGGERERGARQERLEGFGQREGKGYASPTPRESYPSKRTTRMRRRVSRWPGNVQPRKRERQPFRKTKSRRYHVGGNQTATRSTPTATAQTTDDRGSNGAEQNEHCLVRVGLSGMLGYIPFLWNPKQHTVMGFTHTAKNKQERER